MYYLYLSSFRPLRELILIMEYSHSQVIMRLKAEGFVGGGFGHYMLNRCNKLDISKLSHGVLVSRCFISNAFVNSALYL